MSEEMDMSAGDGASTESESFESNSYESDESSENEESYDYVDEDEDDEGDDKPKPKPKPKEQAKEESKDKESAPKKEDKKPDSKEKPKSSKISDEDLDKIATVKINGEVKEMPLREVIKLQQLEQVSHQKLREATTLKQKINEFLTEAKKNPEVFFKQVGMDPEEFAETLLAKKLEYLQMSDEQRRMMELEQENKRFKETAEQTKARQAQEAQAREYKTAQAQLDKDLGEAFKESGLPKHPFYVAQIAFEMRSALKRGEDLTAKEAVGKIKARRDQHFKETLSVSDVSTIQKLLGDEVLEKLRQADIERVTGRKSAPLPDSQGSGKSPVPKSRNKEPEYVNEEGYHKWLESLKRNV